MPAILFNAYLTFLMLDITMTNSSLLPTQSLGKPTGSFSYYHRKESHKDRSYNFHG